MAEIEQLQIHAATVDKSLLSSVIGHHSIEELLKDATQPPKIHQNARDSIDETKVTKEPKASSEIGDGQYEAITF